MRLLVLSDLHDEEEILEKLKASYSRSSFDAIFICGDLTNHSYSYAKDAVSLFPNTYFIPGNNEPKGIVEKLEKEKGWIHGKTATAEGFRIIGFGYSNVTPFGTPGELAEEEIYSEMSKLPIDSKTLLLCHVPPFGYFDKAPNARGKNIGSTSVLRIIQEKKPFAVFCGHVHEYSGVEKIGETFVVKVPAGVNGKYCMVHTNYPNLSAKFFSV